MLRFLLSVSLMLVLLPQLASAKDVVIDDRALGRHINSALDEVDEIERSLDKSSLTRREKDSFADELDKLRTRVKRLRKTLDRGESHKDGVLVNDRDLFADIDDVVDSLKTFEALVDGSELNRDERKRMRERFESVRDAMDAADKLISGSTGRVEQAKVVEPAVVVPAAPVEMDAGSFAALSSTVKKSSFDSDKVTAIATATRSGNYFSCAQVVSLLAHLSFDSDKVEAAATMYPNVVDPKNWFSVYNAFTFDSSRDDLRARLGL